MKKWIIGWMVDLWICIRDYSIYYMLSIIDVLLIKIIVKDTE